MKILIVSDAWHPQINGVVRTLQATERELRRSDHDVEIIGAVTDNWRSFSLPTYPDVTLELFAGRRLLKAIDSFRPDAIHIATEGPLGWAARGLCLKNRWPFTTAYHTRLPEYVAARVYSVTSRTVENLAYATVRKFHAPSGAVMVPTSSIENELREHGFKNLERWRRGVDTSVFRPCGKSLAAYADMPRPILLYVGRVSVEKNLPAFLKLETPGSKVVVGDGPDMPRLLESFPNAHFLGSIDDNELLARHYSAADLFVFPSLTDTFGLVLMEACAAGLRVAGYPAPGPSDVFADPATRSFAVLEDDLQQAVDKALTLPDTPDAPRKFAEGSSWEACTAEFLRVVSAPHLRITNL